MFLNSSNQLNALVTITFCEKISMIISFFQHFWHLLKFPQLSSSFFQFCPYKTGRNKPKVIDFFVSYYKTVPINQMHLIFSKKLSMIIIFFQHFWHLSQFFPVLSSFFQFCRAKLEEIGFFHFFPGVPEEIGFFRKKTNPADKELNRQGFITIRPSYRLYAI